MSLNWNTMDDLNNTMLSPSVLANDGTPKPDANGDGEYSEQELETLRTYWAHEILRAMQVRANRIPAWRASRKAYQVKQNRVRKSGIKDGKDYTDNARTPVKVSNAIHYSNTEIITSNIMANEPKIKVTDDLDSTSASLAIERLVQSKLSYFLRNIRFSQSLMDLIYDLALNNICIAKVGYSDVGTHMLAAPANSPFCVRLSPFNFLADAEAANDDNARWLGEEFYLDARELKEEDGYINVNRCKRYASDYYVNPEGIREDEQATNPYDAMENGEETSVNISSTAVAPGGRVEPASIKRLHMVDIYDKINRKVITGVLSNNSLVCIAKIADIPKHIISTPYKVCTWNYVPDNLHGVSDYEIIESKLREIDKIEQRILDMTKALVPKYAFDKSGVSKDEIEDFVRSELMACVGINGGNVKLDNAIIPFQLAAIPRENFQALQDLRQQIYTDLGITDFMRGQSGSENTATEASIIDAASKTRSQKRQNKFDNFLDDIVKAVYRAMSVMQFEAIWINEPGKYPVISRDENGKLAVEVDDTGAVVYRQQRGFKLTKDMLKPYQIEVERGSTSARKNIMERQTALELYKITKGDPVINPMGMARELLLAFGKDPDKLLITPEQMQQQVTEMQTAEMGGAPPNTEADALTASLNSAQSPPQMPNATADVLAQQ